MLGHYFLIILASLVWSLLLSQTFTVMTVICGVGTLCFVCINWFDFMFTFTLDKYPQEPETNKDSWGGAQELHIRPILPSAKLCASGQICFLSLRLRKALELLIHGLFVPRPLSSYTVTGNTTRLWTPGRQNGPIESRGRLGCVLELTREPLVLLPSTYGLNSWFCCGMNVSAVLWLSGNNELLTLFLFLLASSLDSLEANIKVCLPAASVDDLFPASVSGPM